MNLVRGLERRLERLLEGVTGKVFSGRLHPAEMATRLAREVDFARYHHPLGPASANRYTIGINPSDLDGDPRLLEEVLTRGVDSYATEEGLRLEGPCQVVVRPSSDIASGSLTCRAEVVPGPPVVWGRLVGDTGSVDLGRNRLLVGRSDDADAIINQDDVSRRHALIYRKGGGYWVEDMGSANGTTADGRRVGSDPVAFGPGTVLGFATQQYRFIES